MTTWPHAGQYGPDTFSYPNGAAADGAVVTVHEQDGTTLATLYVDRDRSDVAANPGVTDDDGNLLIYAEPGVYQVTINGGYGPAVLPIVVHPDPEDLLNEAGVARLDAANVFTAGQSISLPAADAGSLIDALRVIVAARLRARLTSVATGASYVPMLLLPYADPSTDAPTGNSVQVVAVDAFSLGSPQILFRFVADGDELGDAPGMPLVFLGLDNNLGIGVTNNDLAAAIAGLTTPSEVDAAVATETTRALAAEADISDALTAEIARAEAGEAAAAVPNIAPVAMTPQAGWPNRLLISKVGSRIYIDGRINIGDVDTVGTPDALRVPGAGIAVIDPSLSPSEDTTLLVDLLLADEVTYIKQQITARGSGDGRGLTISGTDIPPDAQALFFDGNSYLVSG